MKRIDKIYNNIKAKSINYTIENFIRKQGFSTSEISSELNILRNNVSMMLSKLVKMDKIVKFNTRPVLYFHKQSLEKLIGYDFLESPIDVEDVKKIINYKINSNNENIINKDPFDYIIGSNLSLKTKIEQAKAAILYPPRGLNTLIFGETGSGKTLFANIMYKYAIFSGRLKQNSPFIIFNCADYYNNPQLLLSYIFGHIKGAFTGANTEKSGLVEQANGGILFLDEIHRLPPEGQEMIFYFMDTGNYSRLGETERNRKANVLIIGATTEEPDSSLLKTFTRRIPIVINIPSLKNWDLDDKSDIIKHLVYLEANRINKPIKITENVFKDLLKSTSYNNIGKLKSNIQLICANSFLYSLNNKDNPEIKLESIPDDIIKDSFNAVNISSNDIENINDKINSSIIIMPNGNNVIIGKNANDVSYCLYKDIGKKVSMLEKEGMNYNNIEEFICKDTIKQIKLFYNKSYNESELKQIFLNIDVMQFAIKIQRFAENEIQKKCNERFLYTITLHISSFLKKDKEDYKFKYNVFRKVFKENPEEYRIAMIIKNMIEDKYKIAVLDIECMQLTLLLCSIKDLDNNRVGILVITHGNSTASSMVNVATSLLGESQIAYVDMPLDIKPSDISEEIIRKVKQVDKGKGVVLLVDMGSLSKIESFIIERTNIRIKTIDMVSTALVIKAVEKSIICEMSLDKIYNLLKEFKKNSDDFDITDESKKVVIVISSSGEGTIKGLKELVIDLMNEVTNEKIKVIALGAKDLKNRIEEIEENYKVIAIVGGIRPNIDAPFISLESLIGGKGDAILKNLITDKNTIITSEDKKAVIRDLCEDNLVQFLTYLNPHKLINVLMDFVSLLEENMKINFSNSIKLRIIIHTAYALERMLTKNGLKYNYEISKFDKNIFNIIKKVSVIFESSIKITLTDDEVVFITEILS